MQGYRCIDHDASLRSSILADGCNTPKLGNGKRLTLRVIAWLSLILLISLMSGQVAIAQALNPSPVETYYVPVTEQQALASMDAINSAATTPVNTYLSVAIGTDGTLLYFDHWENGYVDDIANPTLGELFSNPGQLDGVQIWGNGNCEDGFPPNKDGSTALSCNAGNAATVDSLSAGNVIVLSSAKSASELSNDLTTLQFDGRDKFAATEQIAVARAYWGGGDCTSSSGPGTCLAGAIEVYPTVDWGTLYLAPVGVNENYSSQFEYAAFVIQAAEDDTNITVIGASIGSTQCSAGSLTNLDQGQSCIVPGVNLGASVTAADGKPVQVHLLTGDINSSYEYDAFTLVPRAKWGPSYYSPVGTTASFPAQIIIYNPGQGTSGTGQLDVRCVFGNGTGITRNNIAANDTASVEVPANYGARCYAKSGDNDGAAFLPTAQFFAISVVDSAYEGTGGGESYDWGFTLIPDELLSPQALVGLGLGQDPTKPLT